MTYYNQLEALSSLKDDWDGEPDAIKPSELAISIAQRVVDIATNIYLPIEDIDADALGGIAIYVPGIWISIRNDGNVIMTDIFHTSWAQR